MSSTGTSRGTIRRRAPALSSSRRLPSCVGLHGSNGSCEGGGRPGVVADVMGRCTRVACAAVITLVLLGDNTSARVSSPCDCLVCSPLCSSCKHTCKFAIKPLSLSLSPPSSLSPTQKICAVSLPAFLYFFLKLSSSSCLPFGGVFSASESGDALAGDDP